MNMRYTSYKPIKLSGEEITDLVKGIRYSCETILNNFPDVQLILATPLQRISFEILSG